MGSEQLYLCRVRFSIIIFTSFFLYTFGDGMVFRGEQASCFFFDRQGGSGWSVTERRIFSGMAVGFGSFGRVTGRRNVGFDQITAFLPLRLSFGTASNCLQADLDILIASGRKLL